MNIKKLKNVIRLVPSVNDITHGNEYVFTEKIKEMIKSTNYQLLGEQLIVGKDNKIGKCDLWLANKHKFLVSLELKVGYENDLKKQNFLKTQVFRYTDFMRSYYPENIIYGLGAYKCIVKYNDTIKGTGVLFTDYIIPDKPMHINEINELKKLINKNCLN